MGEIPEEPLPQEDREDLINLQDYSYPEIEEDPVVEQLQDDVPAMEHRDKSKGILLLIDLSLRCKDLLFVVF